MWETPEQNQPSVWVCFPTWLHLMSLNHNSKKKETLCVFADMSNKTLLIWNYVIFTLYVCRQTRVRQ